MCVLVGLNLLKPVYSKWAVSTGLSRLYTENIK
jgi:hypothetical protein